MSKKEVIVKETRLSSDGGGVKGFFSKLSRGLMLPIALLPIAGLFLGVGAGIENAINVGTDYTASQAALFIPDVISKIGDIIFGNLALLFALGVAVAFAKDAGVAVLSAAVGWIVFNATQQTMIWDNPELEGTFNILWYSAVPGSVITKNVGIQSMQTSVFGGITIGLVVAYLYNRFHTFQMPTVLGFFSGTRFVPIITFLFVPFVAFGFLIIWPLFGIGLDKFGAALMGMPAGLDSFIFGVVERSLIPFGLHHAFYTPLWYTSAGGQLLDSTGTALAAGNQSIWFEMQANGIPFTVVDGNVGDWTSVSKTIDEMATLGITSTTNMLQITNTSTGAVYYLTEGYDPGAYMQGKYPFMIFGLPAAGLAMVMAAKKENRQVAMSVIGAAALTSFLTGITEPIEFTFLFLAPVLYYGFHIWMAGLSFWLMDVLNAHMGMTFSGGIFDFVLFGIIPDATHFHANCYWVLVIGAVYAPIYYFVFYFYITKKDVKTPGREDNVEDIRMLSKADYNAKKDDKKSDKNTKDDERKERVLELEENLGGLDNLEVIDACITRLRLTVKDRSKVNDEKLKAMGAKGIVGGEKAKAIQIIFGAEADRFKVELKDLQKERNN